MESDKQNKDERTVEREKHNAKARKRLKKKKAKKFGYVKLDFYRKKEKGKAKVVKMEGKHFTMSDLVHAVETMKHAVEKETGTPYELVEAKVMRDPVKAMDFLKSQLGKGSGLLDMFPDALNDGPPNNPCKEYPDCPCGDAQPKGTDKEDKEEEQPDLKQEDAVVEPEPVMAN